MSLWSVGGGQLPARPWLDFRTGPRAWRLVQSLWRYMMGHGQLGEYHVVASVVVSYGLVWSEEALPANLLIPGSNHSLWFILAKAGELIAV